MRQRCGKRHRRGADRRNEGCLTPSGVGVQRWELPLAVARRELGGDELVAPDHLGDDEGTEGLGEGRVEPEV